MTEGRQPFTAEIKTLAKGPSTYDPLENTIGGKRAYRSHLEKDRSWSPKPTFRCERENRLHCPKREPPVHPSTICR